MRTDVVCISRSNARIETLMTYAQSVYLLFASVYMCKETVEHVLLAHDDSHHHNHGEVSALFGCVCSSISRKTHIDTGTL